MEIKTFKPVGGVREFTGFLTAFDESTITIETPSSNEGEGEKTVFNRKDIAVVRLTLDF